MDKNKRLEDFAKVIGECVKCGVCQAHCPTYQVGRREGAVARGKIALAKAVLEGETGLEKRLQEDISLCLMCGSCVQKCPNKVPTNDIVGAVRREVTDNQGLSLIGHGVSTLLSNPKLMKTLGKGGSLLSPLFLKEVPETSGLRLRFPFPLMKDRTVPQVADKTLFQLVPEFTKGQDGRPTIGFFAGCAITYLYPQIGKIMVDILVGLGFSVVVPRSQRCCGIPALSSGNGRLVERLSAANMAAFSSGELQHIVTACGSCNAGIGEYYHSMKIDHEAFTSRVIDFAVLLKKEGLFEKLAAIPAWEKKTRVSYHDPCHLKTQGITKEPRELLKSLPNVDFVEMARADQCCGLGGTFSVYHYDQSKAIGARKIEGIEESGASQVATGCPGCIMQLQDTINHAGLKVRAVHILELVAQALQLPTSAK